MTNTRTQIAPEVVYFWTILTLPARIALFVGHVYLLNMAAMVKLGSLSLTLFVSLLIYTNGKIRAQMEQAVRPQPALIQEILSSILILFRSLLALALTGMRLWQLQCNFLLDASQFLRSWASAQTWLIKLVQR